jgi:hypothetical protein
VGSVERNVPEDEDSRGFPAATAAAVDSGGEMDGEGREC